MIHLDTNAVIVLSDRRSHPAREKFEDARKANLPIAISIVVYHELYYGAAASSRIAANIEKLETFLAQCDIAILPFAESHARDAADIRAHLRRLGTPIGPYDMLIAGHARADGATLITNNMREFARVPGLLVVDWAA